MYIKTCIHLDTRNTYMSHLIDFLVLFFESFPKSIIDVNMIDTVSQPAALHVTKQLHCTVYNLELTLRQWSDLLTIFPTRWHLKVLNYVCFLTFTCELYAHDSLKKYPDSYLSSWQQVTRPCHNTIG